MKAELSVTPDRVMLECEFASEEEQSYMFLINVLDEEKTVLTVMQGDNSDKEYCDLRFKKVSKVLNTGKSIYIGGMGVPKHGVYHGNGRVLQLMVIANENGACYGAYIHDGQPCPGDFPVR
jgi:hypothetical protein